MLSTFHGIETGKSGVIAHKSALNTVGHNLANSANGTYSRQQVTMGTLPPIYAPALNRAETAGQIGQGVQVEQVERIRDAFLDDRIFNEKGTIGYWEQKDSFLHQVEILFGEPASGANDGLSTLKGRFEEFIKNWNSLANYPTEGGHREQLRDTAKGLVANVKTLFDQLLTLQQTADARIVSRVDEINGITKSIASLNVEIMKVETMGDHPNDLYDRRDALVEKLSQFLDITVSRAPGKEYIVYLGSQKLVQGQNAEKILAVQDKYNNGFAKLTWERDGKEIAVTKGEIRGLLEIRDVDIANQIAQLDTFAINLTETVNSIHRDSFSLNHNSKVNFFLQQTLTRNTNGDFDSNKDGVVDATGIYKVSGTQKLDREKVIGSSGTLNFGPSVIGGSDVIINYQSTDKVKDIIDKINKCGTNVVAYLDHNSNLTLKACRSADKHAPDFVMKHVEDSGNFLVGFSGVLKNSGQAGSFDWNRIGEISKFAMTEQKISLAPDTHPAQWIGLSENILRDANNIAASRGVDTNGDGIVDKMNGENDGSAALDIVASLVSETEANNLDMLTKIDHETINVDKYSRGFGSFLNNMIADLGTFAQSAKLQLQEENSKFHHLINTRESISGVNIDEEISNLIKYQHGYNASARFISVVDKLLETIITRMG